MTVHSTPQRQPAQPNGQQPGRRAGVDEHIDRLHRLLAPVLQNRESITLDVDQGPGGRLVSAAEVKSPVPLPGFDNSQMDGFALRLSDLVAAGDEGASPRLRLVGIVPAGTAAAELVPGTCQAVMTGSPIPAGADAVIPVERTADGFSVLDAHAAGEHPFVHFTELQDQDLQTGRFIRTAGSDLQQGAVILQAGDVMTPARWGLLAGCGIREITALSPIRTLVITTGEEIQAPGEPLAPGQLYDASRALIREACQAFGHQVITARIPSDEPATFIQTLEALQQQHQPQLIITAGGISAGAYEVVRQGLQARGVEFGSVAQQPGGPQGWGRLGDAALVAMPGNPVSTAVTLQVLLHPVLAALDPACPPQRRVLVHTAEQLSSPAGLRQYRRVRLQTPEDRAVAEAHPVGGPSSHLLAHLAAADALLELREDDTEVPAGTEREAILL